MYLEENKLKTMTYTYTIDKVKSPPARQMFFSSGCNSHYLFLITSIKYPFEIIACYKALHFLIQNRKHFRKQEYV